MNSIVKTTCSEKRPCRGCNKMGSMGIIIYQECCIICQECCISIKMRKSGLLTIDEEM